MLELLTNKEIKNLFICKLKNEAHNGALERPSKSTSRKKKIKYNSSVSLAKALDLSIRNNILV